MKIKRVREREGEGRGEGEGEQEETETLGEKDGRRSSADNRERLSRASPHCVRAVPLTSYILSLSFFPYRMCVLIRTIYKFLAIEHGRPEMPSFLLPRRQLPIYLLLALILILALTLYLLRYITSWTRARCFR